MQKILKRCMLFWQIRILCNTILTKKHPRIDEKGYVLYYTNQCPFNAKYVPVLEETAEKNGISFKTVKIENKEEAQNAPTPITTYALFYDGEYVTNEQMNDKKFLKLAGG